MLLQQKEVQRIPSMEYTPTPEQQRNALQWAINDNVHPLRNECLIALREYLERMGYFDKEQGDADGRSL
jgi:hypothetical protein